MKKAISIVLSLVILLSLTSCTHIKTIELGVFGFTNRNINKYESLVTEIGDASEYMPALDTLDGYTDISFSHQHSIIFIFEADSIALFVEYPDDIYEDKKTQVLDSYEFLEATIISEDGKNYQSAPATFEYGEYDFRTTALPDSLNSMVYMTKSFAFIGINDDKNRIAFCYFYDIDLDTMGSTEQSEQEMITEFIDDYFDWNDLPQTKNPFKKAV